MTLSGFLIGGAIPAICLGAFSSIPFYLAWEASWH
jgi:hypothetical protein